MTTFVLHICTVCMQSEKTALTTLLEESKEECEANRKQLKEMNEEVQSLQVEVMLEF